MPLRLIILSCPGAVAVSEGDNGCVSGCVEGWGVEPVCVSICIGISSLSFLLCFGFLTSARLRLGFYPLHVCALVFTLCTFVLRTLPSARSLVFLFAVLLPGRFYKRLEILKISATTQTQTVTVNAIKGNCLNRNKLIKV